jgi:hypothetical protein
VAAAVDADAAGSGGTLGHGGGVGQPQLDDQIACRQPLGGMKRPHGKQRQRRAQRAARSIRFQPSHAPMVARRGGTEARDNGGFEASSAQVGQAVAA